MVTHKKTPTGYSLTRDWFNFAANNYGKVSPTDGILFLYIVDLCNRLNWKPQFGIPTTGAMEAIGVKSWRAYNKALHNLIEFGFIRMVQASSNQYTANIIAIENKSVALSEAEALALTIAQQEHEQQQGSSTADVDKPKNLEPEKPSNLETSETGETFLPKNEKSPHHSDDSGKKESRVSAEPLLSKKETTEVVDVQTPNWGSGWPHEIIDGANAFFMSRHNRKAPMDQDQVEAMSRMIDRHVAENGDDYALLSNIDTAIVGGYQAVLMPKLY